MNARLRLPAMAAVALTLATVVALAGLACAHVDDDRRILVFAAASLTDAVGELADEYRRAEGVEVEASFAGSVALARQIVAGAPADVFISAGGGPVEILIDEGLVNSDGARAVLGNELVIAVGAAAAAFDTMNALDDLTSESAERIAVVDPGLGPAGAYTEEALRSVGLWETLLAKLLLAKDVRAAMTYVKSGNADAAIVYRTDAAPDSDLKIAMAIPAELHAPIAYLAAVVADSTDDEDSVAFVEFLSSERAAAIFRDHGFTDPPPYTIRRPGSNY